MKRDTMTSNHHIIHAIWRLQAPHTGTQTSMVMSIKVANPMGINANENTCTGSLNIACQVFGYIINRNTLSMKKTTKRTRFNTKKTIDIQESHNPLYGSWWSRVARIPVPNVTKNHLWLRWDRRWPSVEGTYSGEKSRIILFILEFIDMLKSPWEVWWKLTGQASGDGISYWSCSWMQISRPRIEWIIVLAQDLKLI